MKSTLLMLGRLLLCVILILPIGCVFRFLEIGGIPRRVLEGGPLGLRSFVVNMSLGVGMLLPVLVLSLLFRLVLWKHSRLALIVSTCTAFLAGLLFMTDILYEQSLHSGATEEAASAAARSSPATFLFGGYMAGAVLLYWVGVKGIWAIGRKPIKSGQPPRPRAPAAYLHPITFPISKRSTINHITKVHSMKWKQTAWIVIAILAAVVLVRICINVEKTDRPGQDDAMIKEVHDKALKTIQEARAKMEEEPVTPSVPEGFKLQEFPEEHFEIAFPGTPTVKKYALAVEYFAVTTEETGYSVIVEKLPRRLVGKEAESFLTGELESKIAVLKEGAGAELTESNKCVVDGNPALTYQYQLEIAGVIIIRKGTNVLVGDRMYGISIFCRQDASSRSNYDEFVNSFKCVTN